MSDTRTQATGSAQDRKMSLQTSLATGLGVGSLGVLADYLSACSHAGRMIAVPSPVVYLGLGTSVPFIHLLGRIVLYWLGRLLPKDAS